MEFATKAIHKGQKYDCETGAISPPIYMTSTFVQEEPGKIKEFEYTRIGNPNFSALEDTLASLEGGSFATIFSSGLGAMTALFSTLQAGDRLAVLDGIYGGTHRLLTEVFHKQGIVLDFVAIGDWEALEVALSKAPRMVFFESPTNPLLKIVDIARVSEMARGRGVMSAMDNTFATPYLQQPLQLGVDIVVHSTTKYLGGHSDVVGGAVVTNDAAMKEKMDGMRKVMGLNPSPFDAWLIARGVKTLPLRMQCHCKSAQHLAEHFAGHSLVKKVYYPGLASHEGHATAKKQMRGFGGVVSVEFALEEEKIKKLVSSFSYFSLAASLGGVESLVAHPATMTHPSIPREERIKSGLSDTLVRFSIGIEDVEDLVCDIEQGLQRLKPGFQTFSAMTSVRVR